MRKVTALSLTLFAVACGGPEPQPADTGAQSLAAAEDAPIALTPLQEEGRQIYQTICWTCHGPAGRGDGPAVKAGAVAAPPSFHAKDYAEAPVDRLERRFRVGMEGADPNHPHMQYVASVIRPERFRAALSYIPALSYPPEIPGSTIAGQKLYNFRCAGCHGEDGRGNGPAAESLQPMKPADFTRDTLIAAKDWDAVYNRIREGGQKVHGSSMPAWGIVLSDAEIWDLVAYLATLQPGLLSPPRWAK